MSVWDGDRAMHAICVDNRTSEPISYAWADLYAMWFSIYSLFICCGEGNLTDYYAIDDIRLVVPPGGDVETNTQSERNLSHFQEKKDAKKASRENSGA